MKIHYQQPFKGGLDRFEYNRIHRVIRRNFGAAKKCSNLACANKSKCYEWALITGRSYSENITDYIELCKSCHRIYDYKESTRRKMHKLRIGKCSHNRERIVARFSEDDMQLYRSVNLAAIDNKMTSTAISNCLAGRSKMANGFKWMYR